MSAQENLRLIETYFEKIRPDFFTEDAEAHDMSQPEPIRGRKAIAAFMEMFLGEAFPDARYERRNIVADDSRVVVEWTFHGTNRGSFMGSPPTGRAVSFPGVSSYEIENGKIRRLRVYYDTRTVADQLGLLGDPIPSTERQRWSEWWQDQVGQA